MKNQIKKTTANFKATTPKKARLKRNVGLTIAGLGLIFKVACLVFPATMPIGVAAFAGELLWGGLGLGLGVAAWNQNKTVK